MRQVSIPFCKSAIQWKELLSLISQTNFNPREIQPENSSYVASFAERIDQIRNTLDRIHRNVPLSLNIRQAIWVSLV